jgi:hypothetical protein
MNNLFFNYFNMRNIKKVILVIILSLSFGSTFAIANPASVKCEEDG